jgi:hypothetical protein
MSFARVSAAVSVAACVASPVFGQGLLDFVSSTGERPVAGWGGFMDVSFLLDSVLVLTLATLLGLAIGYHPKAVRAADTLEEVEAPKVYALYAVVGAIIGLMVQKYGLVAGFVVFGIGGLIRFRTDLRSASLTGQVILVTLIGLACGLHLPHVAVLATAFGFVLIYILHARAAYRISIEGVSSERLKAAAAAYRMQIEQQGCQILNEKRSPPKQRIVFLVRSADAGVRQRLDELFAANIEPALQGSVDWEVD